MEFNDRRSKASVPKHKHEWYSVGGDNYGPPFEMCVAKEGCTAERHNEERKTPKKIKKENLSDIFTHLNLLLLTYEIDQNSKSILDESKEEDDEQQ